MSLYLKSTVSYLTILLTGMWVSVLNSFGANGSQIKKVSILVQKVSRCFMKKNLKKERRHFFFSKKKKKKLSHFFFPDISQKWGTLEFLRVSSEGLLNTIS